jgi:hypothetical protein
MKSTLKANSIKQTIVYLLLLSFLPVDRLAEFKKHSSIIVKKLATQNGLTEKDFQDKAISEACYRIVAFHQATREPTLELVNDLVKSAKNAEKDTKSLAAFKQQMLVLTAFPGRARVENRLHRNKGCRYCSEPCRFGLFTLASDPNFVQLKELFAAESQKPAEDQTPLMPVYLFTIDHLMKFQDSNESIYDKKEIANLAFCMLMLGMAKSRTAFPEAQIRLFQEANQVFINRT